MAATMTFCALLWNIDFLEWFGLALVEEQYYAFVMAFALGVVFLSVRLDRSGTGRVPWYDVALAALSMGVLLYISANFLFLREFGLGESADLAVALGAVAMVLVIEGLRRSAGLCDAVRRRSVHPLRPRSAIWCPASWSAPGSSSGSSPSTWVSNPNALFGIPLQVGTTIVIMFILMGQLLFRAGGGQFFTELAMATVGRRRGGAAKISVVASALFGTISGTAVSNVVTTGIMTIPLMRRAGYKATHAGAIEAIASTGGQFMPPIMGAAAFLMAEMIEIPYAEIVIAAIVPSLLYYFAVFVQVDLVAARDDISFIDRDLPRARDVLREGWHFILPFAVLFYTLFELNMPPERAAIFSSASLAIAFVKPYRGRKLRVSDLFEVFCGTGRLVIELLMIVSTAGFVIGILNLTGLGFALTFVLVGLAGESVIVLLLISAVICIVLGMGMPTLAIYVLLGALIAPAIVEAGVSEVPAHLFILYFGMMSMITPPIALAAFAAATLTKADPMATGFVAMKYGWTAYFVPFLFVFSPTLILFGDPSDIAINVVTAAIGTYLASVAVIGFLARHLNILVRAILAVAGLAAMLPYEIFETAGALNIAGVAVGVAVCAFEMLAARRKRQVARSL